METNNNSKKDNNIKKIYTKAIDPIYIGTGGYTIGRVDNTIVRDPITKIPKIPGSSLAGTWRYYASLENNSLRCAGQDEAPQKSLEEAKGNKTGHCGCCIICKAFGYSKKDKSWQGMLYFSDLNILFFPVYTRLGVKWITSYRILENANLVDIIKNDKKEKVKNEKEEVFINDNKINEKYINLGWLNLPCDKVEITLENHEELKKVLKEEDIIIVPDNLISQIINSNLEVRTSVSIDPITGASKEGALFTSEAIPRETIFYGEIRLLDKKISDKDEQPSSENIWKMLANTKVYYEAFGIGGMTTRGFGRMKVISTIS